MDFHLHPGFGEFGPLGDFDLDAEWCKSSAVLHTLYVYWVSGRIRSFLWEYHVFVTDTQK